MTGKPGCYGKVWEKNDPDCSQCILNIKCEILTKRNDRMREERRQLELVFEKHEMNSSDLIKLGSKLAIKIAQGREDHRVCSEDVWEVLRILAEKKENYALCERLAQANPTWMGKVFGKTPYFFDTGTTVNRGSHCRLIRVWQLKEEYL